MSGTDEAARLEAALMRIARAAAVHRARAEAAQTALAAARAALPGAPEHGTSGAAADTVPVAEFTARLDALIAELRTVLGTSFP